MRIYSLALIIFFLMGGLSVTLIQHLLNNYIYHDTELCLSKIIESDRLDSVKKYIDNRSTLVIFDIDNTLTAPRLEIGTDQWFSYLCQHKLKEGIGDEDLNTILSLYCMVLNRIPVYLVEEKIFHDMFQHLHDTSIPMIILTARSSFLKERTIEQLTDAGLPLPLTKFIDHEIKTVLNAPAVFYHGIIFCTGKNDKGTVLFHMLDQTACRPQKIIFVDDKYSNLVSVEQACMKRKIPFIGIRYSRLDDRVAQFDSVKAEQELKEVLGCGLNESLEQAKMYVGAVY